MITDIKLMYLDLSDNQLESFPWVALHKMSTLQVINLGRNKISMILDDAERKVLRQINKNMEPMSVFKDLRTLDLSSNCLTSFPDEINVLPKLRELNLMNNQIESVPSSFYTSGGMVQNLRRLFLNQNDIKDLDPKIFYLQKLRVLGLAMTKITKLPPSIIKLGKLKEINVGSTPLKQPKLALAMRGIEAIREFFKQKNQDGSDEDHEEEKNTAASSANKSSK